MKRFLPFALLALLLMGCSTQGPNAAGYRPAGGRPGFLYFFTEG